MDQIRIISGRRAGSRLSPFTRSAQAYFGLVLELGSWSAAMSSRFWVHSGVPSAASGAELGATKLRQREDAKVFVRSFANLKTLHALDLLVAQPFYRHLDNGITDIAHRALPNMTYAGEPPHMCTDRPVDSVYGTQLLASVSFDVSDVLATDEQLHTKAEKWTPRPAEPTTTGVYRTFDSGSPGLDRYRRLRELCLTVEHHTQEGVHALHGELGNLGKTKYIRRLLYLSLTICVCVLSILAHGVNVVSYRESANQVRMTEKVVARLEDSVRRMEHCLERAECLELGDLETQKGVPAPESALYSIIPKLKAVKVFLPQPILSERMRALDPDGRNRPFTEPGFQLFDDVIVLVVSLSDLNASAPQAQDPVKQKSIENALMKFLSLLEQSSDATGGMITEVSADNVQIVWNLCVTPAKMQKKLQELAVETVFQAQRELARDASVSIPTRLGSAVVTGSLIAGNVGIDSLKRFVTLGPILPLARHMTLLASHYNVPCIIDAATEQVLGKLDYLTRPIDFITMEFGDQQEGKSVLYELSGPRAVSSAARDQDTKQQQWMKCFQMLLDGEVREAAAELLRYEQKTRPTTLTLRFTELCSTHPNVVCKDIFDFVEATRK
eukprot:TRINITY_DN43434_c0_g1_i1.p1 TRINITY_DN43434_c0_g1~~TRINITY_DN43434_c0_g1_i1.p1  ORF type:complete len:612 (+),score=161.59 TRINITY_DN43434_c0_g1_i1:750-2585(+)